MGDSLTPLLKKVLAQADTVPAVTGRTEFKSSSLLNPPDDWECNLQLLAPSVRTIGGAGEMDNFGQASNVPIVNQITHRFMLEVFRSGTDRFEGLDLAADIRSAVEQGDYTQMCTAFRFAGTGMTDQPPNYSATFVLVVLVFEVEYSNPRGDASALVMR